MNHIEPASNSSWIYRLRFHVLLAMLTLFILASPLPRLANNAALAKIAMIVVFVAMLASAVIAVCRTRRAVVIVATGVVLVVILQITNLSVESTAFAITRHALGLALLSYIILILLQHLFASTRVTPETICASLCVYLVLGILWSLVYVLIEKIAPGSFALSESEAPPASAEGSGDGFGTYSAVPLYYSFVTLTTLGYGDVLPVKPMAQMVVVIEAIVGPVYLAVLVARLVGMHVGQQTLEKN